MGRRVAGKIRLTSGRGMTHEACRSRSATVAEMPRWPAMFGDPGAMLSTRKPNLILIGAVRFCAPFVWGQAIICASENF